MRRVKTELDAEGHWVSLRKLPAVDKTVEAAIYELIQRYPRYGYRRIAVMLRRKQELVVNRKKVQRIMRRNGWVVTIRPKKFLPGLIQSKGQHRAPAMAAGLTNHVWSFREFC